MQLIDFAVLDWIQAYLKWPILDILMPIISYIGNSGMIWIAISLALIISKKHRKTGIEMAISLILCLLIGNLTLKPLVARIRPCDINTQVQLLIPRPHDFSFPSGHTMSSFASATIILHEYKNMSGILSIVIAFFISFSRLYLYVHYPSDVLAGALIGLAIAVFSVRICGPWIEKMLRKNHDEHR